MSQTKQSATTANNETRLAGRLVLLGASNAARGVGAAIQSARALFEGPFDLLAALGHGRSYGSGSWVLGRWLPGIVDCQLWDDLAARVSSSNDRGPTRALVTDVGNDILYGATAAQIAGWVRTCIERLQSRNCEVTLTGIPLESLDRISSWEFPIFRSMLYPGCFLTRTEALTRAAELNGRLQNLAAEEHVRFVEPVAEWYGRDRIHITRRAQTSAWRNFFAADDREISASSWHEFFAVRTMTPHQRRLLGIKQGRPQPAGTLQDGTRVSLY